MSVHAYTMLPTRIPAPEREIFFAVDRAGVIVSSSGGGLTRLGFADGQLVGRSALTLYPPDSLATQMICRGLEGPKDHQLYESDDGTVWLVTISPRVVGGVRDGCYGHLAPVVPEGTASAPPLGGLAGGPLLPRGVYVARYLEERTGTRGVLLIDRRGVCIHRMSAPPDGDLLTLSGQAWTLLNELDRPG